MDRSQPRSRTTYPVLVRAKPELTSWGFDQWTKAFSPCGQVTKVELLGEDLPHSLGCIVHFGSAQAQHNARQIKQQHFSVVSAQRADKKVLEKKEEMEVRTPSTVPMDYDHRSRQYSDSRRLHPPPRDIAANSPRSDFLLASMGVSAAETPRMTEIPAMLLMASPTTPGCEPQMDVVEPHENRVLSTPRQPVSARRRRRGVEEDPKHIRNSRGKAESVVIYRRAPQIPRTNSGRRVGMPQPDPPSVQRTQSSARVSRNMREVQQPLILAIDDTPRSYNDTPNAGHKPAGHNTTLSVDAHLELSRVDSIDSSLHTSFSGSSRSGSPVAPLCLHIRESNSSKARAKVMISPETSIHSLKMNISQVFDLELGNFRLWNHRSGKFLGDESHDERMKLQDLDLAWDDELIIVSSRELEESEPEPRGPRTESRFQRMERRHISRVHRARTTPTDVVPRSQHPPSFEIQEYPIDDSPRANDDHAVVRPSTRVSEIKKERELRRRHLRSDRNENKRRAARSANSLMSNDRERERAPPSSSSRNRPATTRSRVNVPAITVPRTQSQSNIGERRRSNTASRPHEAPPRSESFRGSNTRVRMSNPIVIRRPLLDGGSCYGGEQSIQLGDIDWSSDSHVPTLVPDVGYDNLLAARETVSSAQQLVQTRNNLAEFASAMNFVTPEQPDDLPRSESFDFLPAERRRPVRRVKVTQQQPIPIRIDSSSTMHRGNSRRRVGDYRAEQVQPNQAVFFFSDEGNDMPPLPPARSVPHTIVPGPPPMRPPVSRASRPERRVRGPHQGLMPPSAIGSYDAPRGRRLAPPSSPLETHSSSPRDDEELARQLARESDADQQRESTQLARMLQFWDHASDEEKYLRPESPEQMMLIEPRRGFVVNDMDASPLTTIFERLHAFSSPRRDFESATYEELLQLDDGIPKTGLSERELWRLPLRTLDSVEQQQRAGKCSVCQEEYELNDELRRLPCMHEYHRHCIDKWLERSKKCPVDMNVVSV